MASLIGHFSKAKQAELLDGLNYLNISEYRSFCDTHGIPYRILIETEGGKTKKSRDTDRKSVVLDRVRHYLKTGRIKKPTLFVRRVVRLDGLTKKPQAGDRLYYGCYDKKNPDMVALLQALTDGEFRNGAIARILCREFWTAGKAPTFKQFAKAWLVEHEKGLGEHPEAAWLTDRARGTAGNDWKKKRERIAKKTLTVLGQILPR